MNEGKNARDTQFQGFAKALWEEVIQIGIDGYYDGCEAMDGGYELLIARRAYDLACHTISSQAQGMDMFCKNDPEWIRQRVELVADMTELPKEQRDWPFGEPFEFGKPDLDIVFRRMKEQEPEWNSEQICKALKEHLFPKEQE
jgi:hypothetical protein